MGVIGEVGVMVRRTGGREGSTDDGHEVTSQCARTPKRSGNARGEFGGRR